MCNRCHCSAPVAPVDQRLFRLICGDYRWIRARKTALEAGGEEGQQVMRLFGLAERCGFEASPSMG